MPKKGLPVQGARALLNSWSDANAAIVNQKKASKPKPKQGKKNAK